MAKLTDRTALVTPADGDFYVTTDVSDTSDAPTGTDKKITWANIKAGMKTYTDTLYAAVLGADDNYVTDAEKAALHAAVTKAGTGTYISLSGQQITADPIDTTDLGAGVLDTDLSSVSASDDTIPSAKATKSALDAKAPLASPTFTGTVTLPTGLTGVLRADSGVVSTDSDVTDLVSAASDSAAGKVELATTAETNTGTDTGRAVTPDGLAGSYAGTKSLSVQVYEGATDVATGDGKAYITIPEALNGMNLIRAQATVVTAGTTNATTVMIHNKTDAQDMLSGAISIASGGTVGTAGTVNGSFDDVATNDVLRIDVDSVSTTAPKGLMVILEFRLP